MRYLEDTSYLKIQKTKRDDIEYDLHFLGFLIMENKLKEATKGTISTLNQCKVRTIMATGDNTLTAISVGRESNFITKDQEVFFGDVVNDRIVWRKAQSLEQQADDEMKESQINSSRNATYVEQSQTDQKYEMIDDTKDVPWENLDEENTNFGVAINGKTLNHMFRSRETYDLAMRKVLYKA